MGKDLFMRLCNTNVELRYSATLALKHPWITRDFKSSIPMNIYEEDMVKELIGKLKKVIIPMLFTCICLEDSVSCMYILERKNCLKFTRRQ